MLLFYNLLFLFTDENECKSSSKCSVDAICKNKVGSFECVCKEGYYGNGRICKGNPCLLILILEKKLYKTTTTKRACVHPIHG